MAETSVERVKAIAQHLKSLEFETIEMYIEDAALEVEAYSVSKKHVEKLERYLAAHFATIDYRRPETETIGDLSTSYKAPREQSSGAGLGITEYGQEFKRILQKSKGFRLAVL
ncbi:hypothetical protein J2S78_002063 [Salibacterium salarium]|uniref:DUF4054 domain-containing protein n=1 Tax=Salibacterium salarium TaxID=284579 RepID=UPI002789853C|nr:DUF4054 domain-containing protein [Salibacterium salarium]MDQ0299643.1 hypothetical protein [Salibacterium salarium]